MGEDAEKKASGPTEEEKEAVRKRFAEMRTAKSQMQHPKEKFNEERQRGIIDDIRSNYPEEWKAQHDEDLILRKPASTWQDYVTQGMILFHRNQLKQAQESMLQAHALNQTAMIPLYYLVLLTDPQTPIISDLDNELMKSKLELPPMFMFHSRYRDLVVLYRAVRDEWRNVESYSYLPAKYQDIATLSFLSLFRLEPSPLLIEIANRIQNGDLKKDHWSFNLFTEYSSLLEDCGLEVTMEEYFVNTIKVALETK